MKYESELELSVLTKLPIYFTSRQLRQTDTLKELAGWTVLDNSLLIVVKNANEWCWIVLSWLRMKL